MSEYINILIICGYSPCDAYLTYHNFRRELSLKDLDAFISYLERDVKHVDRV